MTVLFSCSVIINLLLVLHMVLPKIIVPSIMKWIIILSWSVGFEGTAKSEIRSVFEVEVHTEERLGRKIFLLCKRELFIQHQVTIAP